MCVLSHLCSVSFYFILWLFIKPGIQERGTECGEYRERGECSLGFRGISKRIPGNVLILAFREMFEKIPGNFIKESGECLRRFRGILLMIPGNALEDSGECSRFWKIPENVECSIRRQCSGCREQTLFF